MIYRTGRTSTSTASAAVAVSFRCDKSSRHFLASSGFSVFFQSRMAAQTAQLAEPVLQLCSEYSNAGELVEANVSAHVLSISIARSSGQTMELHGSVSDVNWTSLPTKLATPCHIAISTSSDRAALSILTAKGVVIQLFSLSKGELGPTVNVQTINLFREHVDDEQLSALFETAASNAPSVIVLEDIDRYFSQKHEDDKTARVSLQHLLNCLDGATTQEGVIVVATANNPQVLDAAILRRPGRFDRVVGFANPTRELRVRYFEKLAANLGQGAIAECANASEGSSFAQLQESYILAGQFAFDEERPITGADILTAIATLRKSLQCADWKGEVPTGFQIGRHSC